MLGSQQALAEVRRAFSVRPKPDSWLQSDLPPVDRIDGEEFIEEIKAGAEPRKFFFSAIPYFDFLTVEAAIYLLPDVFSVIAEDSINLVTLLPSFTMKHGKGVFGELSTIERSSVRALLAALKTEANHPLPIALLSEVEAVIDGRKPSIEQDSTNQE